jgi:iron complex transport system ATP-binding protein
VRKGEQTLLDNLSFDCRAGEFVAILGPNGAGKSTLLRLLGGQERATSGEVKLGGKPLRLLDRASLARQVALVEPVLELPFALTAEQVVLMGRAPHATHWFESEEDWAQTNSALLQMDCEHLRHRDFRTLSSGEKQRVLLASALAQQACVLLLDEPAAFLDLAHQRDLFAILHSLTARGYLVVAVTHDWNLAAAWATRILLLRHGHLAADGAPEQLADPQLLGEVFGVELEVIRLAGQPPFVRHRPPGERA